MKSGTKPLLKPPKRHFHHAFGSAAPLADFTVDSGLWNPNQETDNAPTECTGYFVADLATDLFKQLFTPDFSYAAAQYIEGVEPNDGGADFHAALQGFVALGAVPKVLTSFSAATMGELYCANIDNWKDLRQAALRYGQNGTLNALGNGLPYDSILSAINASRLSVALGSPWYSEWENLGPDAVLPMPKDVNNVSTLPWHCYAGKGRQNGGIIVKSWQGPNYGKNGMAFMPPDVANAVFQVPGTGAIGINPLAIRWISLLVIACTRQPALLPLLPQLIAANTR